MNSGCLMKVALKAGEMLLTSGAEIYRVEDTISRICSSYNTNCESFVLPTGIFVSITADDKEAVTSFRRIKQRSVDLNRIDMVNDFSRKLIEEPLTYDEAMGRLAEIEGKRQYGFPIRIAAAGIAAFAFALLFKGSIFDGLAALIIGMLIYIVKERIARRGLFQFFELFVAGLVAGLAAVAAVWLFPDLNLYKIIIGAIMMFLPGVAITNGIKDILYGDLVASITRLGDAAFSVTSIGVGVAVAISIAVKWGNLL
ncbi:MAG: threonine/serine exporter family protein [Clostridiales bacterium]|nr:threonine/serine exporter family protein [Clostridiales bacterium]